MYSSQSGSSVRGNVLTLVKLNSQSIDFEYQPNANLETSFTMKNSTNSTIAYKFKSTNPLKYLVNPVASVVEPQREIKIIFKISQELLKNDVKLFKDSMQLNVALIKDSKETLDNIFKKNAGVIQSESAKIPIRLVSGAGRIINSEGLATSRQFSSPLRQSGGSAFESNLNGSQHGYNQSVIPLDLKGSQDPNSKYQNIHASTDYLQLRLQEREDYLLTVQRETDRYKQDITAAEKRSASQSTAPSTSSENPPSVKQGLAAKLNLNSSKLNSIKGAAVGIFAGILLTFIKSAFSVSPVFAINPLNQ